MHLAGVPGRVAGHAAHRLFREIRAPLQLGLDHVLHVWQYSLRHGPGCCHGAAKGEAVGIKTITTL